METTAESVRQIPGWTRLTDAVPPPVPFQAIYAWNGRTIDNYGMCIYCYMNNFPCIMTESAVIISWHDITHWRTE
jgi:hypothetical protein